MSEVLHLILRMMLEQWKTMDEELIVYRLKQTAEMAEELERERDEAREMQAKALRERESTEREVEAMLERAIKAERERDEARERYNDLLGLKKEPKWYNGREIPIAVEESAK